MRRINPGTVTVAVMAILFGLVATYVVRQSLNKKPIPLPQPVAEVPEDKGVVVATVNVPAHTLIPSFCRTTK